MQSAIANRTPFVASSSRAAPAGPRRSAVVILAAAPQQPQEQPAWLVQRRALAALLVAAPAALSAGAALALIPDDDDEELVLKARAGRKQRLASERQAEKAFSRSEGFTDRRVTKELVEVQLAVNSLSAAGKQLAEGQVAAAADTLAAAWAVDFRRAAQALSVTDVARTSAAAVLSSLTDLQESAARGELRGAKQSYVALVGNLQEWAGDAALTSQIKGL